MVIPHCPSVDLAVSSSEITLCSSTQQHTSVVWGDQFRNCHSCVRVTQPRRFHRCSLCPLASRPHVARCPSTHSPREEGARAFAALDSGSGCWVSVRVGVSLSPSAEQQSHLWWCWKEKSEHSFQDQQSEQLHWTLLVCFLWMDGEKMSSGLQALLGGGEALSMKVIWGANTS